MTHYLISAGDLGFYFFVGNGEVKKGKVFTLTDKMLLKSYFFPDNVNLLDRSIEVTEIGNPITVKEDGQEFSVHPLSIQVVF